MIDIPNILFNSEVGNPKAFTRSACLPINDMEKFIETNTPRTAD